MEIMNSKESFFGVGLWTLASFDEDRRIKEVGERRGERREERPLLRTFPGTHPIIATAPLLMLRKYGKFITCVE